MKLLVILDNGHGIDTKGKCSPDKSILEYKYCREIVDRIIQKIDGLKTDELKAVKLVPEEIDIALSERVLRVKKLASKAISDGYQPILISVHLNASGNGSRWMPASGFSCWVCKGAGAAAKKIAKKFTETAIQMNLTGNRYISDLKYCMSDFYILKKTPCPAVLTENMFQDNIDDVKFLLSEQGKESIVDLHVNVIMWIHSQIQVLGSKI